MRGVVIPFEAQNRNVNNPRKHTTMPIFPHTHQKTRRLTEWNAQWHVNFENHTQIKQFQFTELSPPPPYQSKKAFTLSTGTMNGNDFFFTRPKFITIGRVIRNIEIDYVSNDLNDGHEKKNQKKE